MNPWGCLCRLVCVLLSHLVPEHSKKIKQTTLSHGRQARHRSGLAINKRKRAPLRARVTAGRRWVCASAWAAEAVCERPGSRVGLWGAPCPRGVARLWLGVERGGFCTSCGSSRSSEADRATRLWTCVAAPARGGQVGGCSGGVQRLRNLGGRRGARAERDCGPNALRKECRCFARVYARALPVGAREHL